MREGVKPVWSNMVAASSILSVCLAAWLACLSYVASNELKVCPGQCLSKLTFSVVALERLTLVACVAFVAEAFL